MDERLTIGETWTIVVIGEAATAGSKTVVYGKDGKPRLGKGGRPVMRPASARTKPWMEKVLAIAKSEWGDYPPLDCPIQADIVFYVKKPGTADWDDWPLKSGGDSDKLERAALDPLQGIAFTNDRRVVKLSSERRFGTPERAEITLTRLPLRRVPATEELEQQALLA